ncbi:MAG: ABC transporter permease [Ruminococcus sp.]|nr:ABC transporter permease [Ruminococcus sp.]
MNKLISANFARLFKSGVFKLYMIFSGGLSLFLIAMRYIDSKNNLERYKEMNVPAEYFTMDGLVFVGLLYILFAVPVLVGNFVGTEYSDGTIRNKLIVGHKRSDIYLANLIVCTAGVLMGVILHILINCTVGTALCGMAILTVKKITEITLFMAIAFISITAFMIMLTMFVNSKAGASVTVLILTMIMFIATLTTEQKLHAPEYYEAWSYVDEDTGEIVEVPEEKNPNYLTGTKRKVYQTIYDVIPVSHMYESAMENTKNAGKFAGYDGIVLVVTTALGIILFRKKDLK